MCEITKWYYKLFNNNITKINIIRYYRLDEYGFKIGMLTEYYKYHQDIPRLFMMPTTNIINKYHDKKRRIEYIRITRLIKEENDEDNKDTL